MQKTDLKILLVFVIVTIMFIIQQSYVRNLYKKYDMLELDITDININLSNVYESQSQEISDLRNEITNLKNENYIQSVALEAQAEMLADYDQHVEDLDHELRAYEFALEEVKPKIQLPTTWEGPVLTKELGGVMGPAGRETYYNLPMQGCINKMRSLGYSEEEYPYWIRDDGAKMLGRYVMCAANWKIRPLGTILETSLGWSIVVDTGDFVADYPYGVDMAVDW